MQRISSLTRRVKIGRQNGAVQLGAEVASELCEVEQTDGAVAIVIESPIPVGSGWIRSEAASEFGEVEEVNR